MREFDFDIHARRALRRSGLVLLAAVVALLAWDLKQPVLLGFAVGTAVSIVNGFFLFKGIKTMVSILLHTRELDKAGAFFLLGVPVRWLIILGVLFLAVRTGWFDLLACLGGLFVLPAFAVAGVVRILAARGVQSKCSL